MISAAEPRVVIVHDYATQLGGAERVTLDLLRAFPGSRLVTSLWNPDTTFPEFAAFPVETLALNKRATFRADPRRAFPLLAKAFGRHLIEDADVVICSSSGWSHRVVTAAPKIVYCHNPARWLYQPDDYLAAAPAWARRRFVGATDRLRRSDIVAAREAAKYVANSSVVAARIAEAYEIDAGVVHPARGLTVDGPHTPIVGLQPGYLLTIARRRSYKNADVVIDGVSAVPGERLVVVGGDHRRPTPAGVTMLSGATDSQLRWLFDNAAGLVALAHEDFGLTVVEAQSFGIPALVLRAGGYVDTAVEGVTTVFVDRLEPAEVAGGVRTLRSRDWDHDAICSLGERFSPQRFSATMRALVTDVLATAEQHTRGAHLRPEGTDRDSTSSAPGRRESQ